MSYESLTLDNGSGLVEFYHEEVVVDGWDLWRTGSLHHQYNRIPESLFRQMEEVKAKDGDQAAWAVYHKATP